MNLQQAQPLAEALRDHLGAFVARCEIAGSIRRGKTEVKDIEIVACPTARDYASFLAVLRQYPILKGKPTISARYIKLQLDGIAADVFITTPERWGWTLVLRTGSSEFNIRLLQRLKAHGVESHDGALWQGKNPASLRNTPEEADVFRLAGLDYVIPPGERRDYFNFDQQHEHTV